MSNKEATVQSNNPCSFYSSAREQMGRRTPQAPKLFTSSQSICKEQAGGGQGSVCLFLYQEERDDNGRGLFFPNSGERGERGEKDDKGRTLIMLAGRSWDSDLIHFNSKLNICRRIFLGISMKISTTS